jgi:hypothetical protein
MAALASSSCLFDVVIDVKRENQFNQVDGTEYARCKGDIGHDWSMDAMHGCDVNVEEVRLVEQELASSARGALEYSSFHYLVDNVQYTKRDDDE